MRTSDVERIVGALPAIGERGDEFRYASAPLCVLDAIFSIGMRYESVQALVRRYADHYGLPLHRPTDALPVERDQATVSDLIRQIEAIGAERFAVEVVRNRRPTSSHGGILRAEAARRFALVLTAHRIETLQDLATRLEDDALVRDLRAVHGQGSGIAVKYFLMLAGADQLVKPDRMIMRFLERVLGRRIGADEAQRLLTEAARALGPATSVGAVDYAIWQHERQQPLTVP
jgi:hypothetical protein